MWLNRISASWQETAWASMVFFPLGESQAKSFCLISASMSVQVSPWSSIKWIYKRETCADLVSSSCQKTNSQNIAFISEKILCLSLWPVKTSFVQLSWESVVLIVLISGQLRNPHACRKHTKSWRVARACSFLPLFWLVFWACFPGLCPCLWLAPPWGWSLLWSPEWVLLRSAWYKQSPLPLLPHLHLGGRRKDKCGVWMKRQL